MRNANYGHTWNDCPSLPADSGMVCRRTYNSRSDYVGLFGLGWCSSWETRLTRKNNDTIQIHECRAGKKKLFYKTTQNGSSEKFIYKGRINDSLKKTKKFYIRQRPDGTTQTFEPSGKMISYTDGFGIVNTIVYSNNRIQRIQNNIGQSIVFKYDLNNRRVTEMDLYTGKHIDFSYRGDLLIRVTSSQGNTFNYQYNLRNQLSKIIFPDNTSRVISYMGSKSWVSKYRDRHGCVEFYDYQTRTQSQIKYQVSKVEKRCQGKTTHTGQYEYWYQKSGQSIEDPLVRFKRTTGDQSTEVFFHPDFQKPTKIIKNGKVTIMTYNERGLLQSKKDRNESHTFHYSGRCNAIKTIYSQARLYKNRKIASISPSKKKEIKKVKTSIKYGKTNCRPKTISSSNGQKVNLTYKPGGRISKFKFRNENWTQLTYYPGTKSLRSLSSKDIGKVYFQYNEDGSLRNMKSPKGNKVAKALLKRISNLRELSSAIPETL